MRIIYNIVVAFLKSFIFYKQSIIIIIKKQYIYLS